MKKLLIFLLIVSSFTIAKAKWEQCNNGMFGGKINSIAFQNHSILIGTVNGGIFKSIDEGNSWVNIGVNEYKIKSIAVKDSIILVGSGFRNSFFSMNSGVTWSYMPSNFTSINSVCFSKNNILAASSNGDGIFLSPNNGVNWQKVCCGIIHKYIYSMTSYNDKVYAVIGYDGIYVSTDYGYYWNNIGLKYLDNQSIAVKGDTILIGTIRYGVYLTSDGGINWKNINQGLTNLDIVSLTIKGNKFFAGTNGGGIFCSSDFGESWVKKNNGLDNFTILSLAVKEDNIYAGTDGRGIFISKNDGDSWSAINNGLTNVDVNSFVLDGNNLFIGTSNSGTFLSTDYGDSWENKGLKGRNITSMVKSDSAIICGTDSGAYISNDKGLVWNLVNNGLTNLNIISMAGLDNSIYAGTWGGSIFLTTNKGDVWISIMNNLGFWNIPAIALKMDTIYVISNNGEFYKSSFKDYKWSLINKWGGDGYSIILDNNNMFVCSRSGFFISKDNGITWNKKIIMNHEDIYNLTILNKNIFACHHSFKWDGLNRGVYYSPDYGLSWSVFSSGLDVYSIDFLKIIGSYIYAGTNGRGMYRAKLTDFGITNIDDINFSYPEYSVFPNPASDFIEISVGVRLAELAHTDAIRIFNVFGQIQTTPNPTPALPASREGVRIDVTGLAPGMYFVRIGERVQKFIKL